MKLDIALKQKHRQLSLLEQFPVFKWSITLLFGEENCLKSADMINREFLLLLFLCPLFLRNRPWHLRPDTRADIEYRMFQCLTCGTIVFKPIWLKFCMKVVAMYKYISQEVQVNIMQRKWRTFKIEYNFRDIILSYSY